jgi:hypothetical protein
VYDSAAIKTFFTQMLRPFSFWGTPENLSWFAIAFGAVLRLSQYAHNRSLWTDESLFALYLLTKAPAGLLAVDHGHAAFMANEGLAVAVHHQAAPPGFLAVEQFALRFLGNNEYALRLYPLLCGLAALFIFRALAKRNLSPQAVPVAVGLFALSSSLVYYSSEAKQYSSDGMVAVLLLLAAFHIESERLTILRSIAWGVIGATALWFSHPAIFVLAGIGVTQFAFRLHKKRFAECVILAATGLLWLTSFAVLYIFWLRTLSHDPFMQSVWKNDFFPFPPRSFADLKWPVGAFLLMLKEVVGLTLPGLGAFALIVGGIAFLKGGKQKLSMLLLPLGFTLLASALRKYPFTGRFILFLVPAFIILIAAGVEHIVSRTRPSRVIVGVLLVLLFLHPVVNGAHELIKPKTKEEMKPLLGYVRANWQTGDSIFVHAHSVAAFAYYADRYGLDDKPYFFGNATVKDHGAYIEELDKLRGRGRVWLLFSRPSFEAELSEHEIYADYLDRIGTKIKCFTEAGAMAYLYDLSGDKSKLAPVFNSHDFQSRKDCR